jgi:ribonucleoside-diphosphate reductase alpha chain
VQATDLWRKMLTMLFETGHPWITFKDACNVRSPQQHAGRGALEQPVHRNHAQYQRPAKPLSATWAPSTCCHLARIAEGQLALDHDKLRRTVGIAMRMLDNVIDINYYAVKKARDANLRHRPGGSGPDGISGCAVRSCASPTPAKRPWSFADHSMEALCYYAYWASIRAGSRARLLLQLPVARYGTRASCRPTPWTCWPRRTRRPCGSGPLGHHSDWDGLRSKIARDGMRNSNCVAIAPTATISNIVGVDASIEPCFGNLSVKSNLSGEFTVINHRLVGDLKRLGLWDDVMVMDLKHFKGSLHAIDRVPQEIKALYATAFEVEPRWLVEAASRRQKWIDQAQSLNIYMAGASGKKLDETLYRLAWLRGLKTTYYLRTQSATHVEMSTVHTAPAQRRLHRYGCAGD